MTAFSKRAQGPCMAISLQRYVHSITKCLIIERTHNSSQMLSPRTFKSPSRRVSEVNVVEVGPTKQHRASGRVGMVRTMSDAQNFRHSPTHVGNDR